MINELEVDPDGSLTRRWGTRADDVRVKRTIAALEANGIKVVRAADAAEARRIVLALIPDGSQVHHGSPRYPSRAHRLFAQTKTRVAVRAHRSRVYPRSALKMRKPGKPGFHAQFSPSHFAGYHNAGIFSRIIVME